MFPRPMVHEKTESFILTLYKPATPTTNEWMGAQNIGNRSKEGHFSYQRYGVRHPGGTNLTGKTRSNSCTPIDPVIRTYSGKSAKELSSRLQTPFRWLVKWSS